jgi:FlaA1/EpsC-like NDP-sugar epimerase
MWKRVVLIASDFTVLSVSLWVALSLRYATFYVPPSTRAALLLLAAPLIGIAIFAWLGLYRMVTRYMSSKGTLRLIGAVILSDLVWAMVVLIAGETWMPRAVVAVMYPFLAAASIYASRQLAGAVLRSAGVSLATLQRVAKPIVIYGAGQTGMQLAEALVDSGEGRVVGFLDETTSLWGQYARGTKIYPPDKLERLVEREGVREVILAMPEAQRRQRQQVLKWLERFPVRVRTLPSIEDFAAGRVNATRLRPVEIEDLLGRDPVPPAQELLSRNIKGKSVLVTGAGGSIGSELVRQILLQGPRRLVLLDSSEVALYQIDTEVSEVVAAMPADMPRPAVVPVLGSVLDESLMIDVLRNNAIATIYHAAAYKHVPLVETNAVAGLTNNTFGTAVVARAARQTGVERVVLISTDKAVRPTNIMGGSKRIAELILQAHAADPTCQTVFTMVRFGNVLDSSGSVVRKFRRQIETGGPVTVTHPDIIRYFMSIPEAATLVLQAGAMATGGEVFVLDMGEPVKIAELARSMIRLMGLEVREADNPDGDIAISFVGLRQGEKLFEELLIGDNTTATEHARIMRSSEPCLLQDELDRELAVLKAAMDEGNREQIQAVLMRIVEGYRPEPLAAPITASPAVYLPASRTLH